MIVSNCWVPNGAGKSTLLRTLAGLHGQYTGAFWCDNFLFQGHRVALDELLTPIENLRWFGAINGHQFTHEQMREVLAKVDNARHGINTPARSCRKVSSVVFPWHVGYWILLSCGC